VIENWNKALDSKNLKITTLGYIAGKKYFQKNFLPLTMIPDDCSADSKTAFWNWKTGFSAFIKVFKDE
jgi:hypothetical protein